jgi:hypothetical protein
MFKTFSFAAAIICLCLSAGAQASRPMETADFTGHWKGTGKTTSTFGVNMPCTSIDIEIVQSATEFVIKRYSGKCGINDSDWGPSTMQIQGGDVMQDGAKVGSVDGLSLQSAATESGVVYIFNMTKVLKPDGTFSVQSKYGTQNSIGNISIDGLLEKQ